MTSSHTLVFCYLTGCFLDASQWEVAIQKHSRQSLPVLVFLPPKQSEGAVWAGCCSDPAENRTQSKSSTCVVSAAHQQTAAGCAMRQVIYYSKVLRAASYSAASRSARSGACDPAMFAPEKISPDSLAAGREHAGWDVCFLQLLFVFHDFSSTNLSSPSSALLYDDDSLSFDLLPPIHIPVHLSDFFSSISSFCSLCVMPVLRVLRRRGAGSDCPVSQTRSSCSWLPALPEARHL